MNGFKKYFSNTAWMVGGRVLKATLNFAVAIAVARYLGPERYGVLNYAMGIAILFTIFSAMGLDNVLVRELVGKNAKNQWAILGSASVLQILGSGLAMLFTAIFLLGAEADLETWILTSICAASFLFTPGEIFRGYYEAKVDARTITIVEFIQTIISSGLRISAILMHQSVFWFAVCWLSEKFLTTLGFFIAYRLKQGSLSVWSFNREIFVHLLKESLPLLVSAMAIVVYQQFDKIMLKALLENSANDEIGLYSAALRVIPFVALIPQMMGKALVPSLINVKKHDQGKYQERTQLFLDLMTWVGILLSATLCLMAPLIIFCFGKEYSEATPILQIVSWKGLFIAMSTSSGLWIVTEGVQKMAVLRNLAGCLINIGLNWMWIPKYGAMGSAWATLISFGVAAYFSHLLIPAYRRIFVMQTNSIFSGLIRLLGNCKSFLQNR